MSNQSLSSEDQAVVDHARKLEQLREAFEQRFKLDIWPVYQWLKNNGGFPPTQPAAGEPVAWRELADDGTPLTDWIDGAPRSGTEPAPGGETIQVAWSGPSAAAPVAAGEPVATLMLRRSFGSLSVGVVRFDADQLPHGTLVDVYAAPPAAAHGDEYEIWSAAQLAPGEGIEDGAERIRALICKPAAHGDDAAAFANELISGAMEGGDFCGADIQELAVKHGLLREERREEACREEGCACAEYGFPTECYRKTAALAPPVAAHGDEAVRKDATESAIQRACGVLPEGWSMQIDLERDAGWVTLFNPWGRAVDFGQDFGSIGAHVEAAIDAAMRAQGDGGGS